MARILSRVAIGAVAAGALITSQLATSQQPGGWDIGDAQFAGARLEVASDCAEVTTRVREIVDRQGRASYGYGSDGSVVVDTLPGAVPAPAAPVDQAESAGRDTTGGPVVGTNVQEFGVDETDQIKTDGTTIWALRDNKLIAVDAASLTELDRIGFGKHYPYEMLLSGDRLVLFESWFDEAVPSDGAREAMPWFGGSPQVRMTIVDASNTSEMTIASVVTVDGSLVAARLVEGYVRVVVSTSPVYWFGGLRGEPAVDVGAPMPVAPRPGKPAPSEPAELTAEDVLPTITIEQAGATTSEPVPCDSVHIAPEAETVESTTVFSLDPNDPRPLGSVTALTGSGIVYANPRSIYLARSVWTNRGGEQTEIHRFDISDPVATRYVSVGTLQGSLLNQFSMSEHEGLLRVATTFSGTEANGFASDSRVSVMREVGGALNVVGSVGDLGTGERIFAVRFLGPLGYVVTFRQVDPLYVIDLSDPADPRVAGELKIPGYSAYLHPLGDGLIVGVGQDADAQGRTRGVLVSLFDVTNPANPRRIAKLDELGQWSPIEGDHKAFQYLPEHGLIVVPVSTWSDVVIGRPGVIEPEPAPPPEEPTEGSGSGSSGSSGGGVAIDEPVPPDVIYQPSLESRAYVIRASADGLEVVGSISHGSLVPAPSNEVYRTGEITRSIAIGDTLYTMSDAALTATDLGSLERIAALTW